MHLRVFLFLSMAVLGPLSLTVQAGKIYWCDRNVGLVQRANLDGSEIETLIDAGSTNLRGIAVDVPGGKVYFADNAPDKKNISRANLDGSQMETLVEDRGFPADVCLDLQNRKLYWCDQQRNVIERSNLDGSLVETVIETPNPYYLDLDLSQQRVFWGDFSAGNIHYVSLAGGDPVNVFTGQPRVRGVKLDLARGEMVWCNRQSNHIQRRKIEGGPVHTVITDLDTPHGLVIDPVARKAYWCDTGTDNHNAGGKAINRTDLDMGGPLETVAELSQPWDADLDLRTESYAAYVARYFRIGRTETDLEGDFDGDGYVQLLEYGMASHPERKDLVPQYGIELDNAGLALVYKRFEGAGDLLYQVEISDDMQVWHSNADGQRVTGDEITESLPHGVEQVRVPIVGEGEHLRLRVTFQK